MNQRQAKLNLATFIIWIVASIPVLSWAWQTLTHDQHRMSFILFALVVGAGIMRVRDIDWRGFLRTTPRTTWKSVTLICLGISFFLVGENIVDIDILSALGFAVATSGLLHAFLPTGKWLRSIVPLMLLVGVLPFQFHLEAYVGFPLRAATAKLVGMMMGIESDAMSTVLMMENQVAAVDLPCSGLKSLWVGILFFLASSMMMNVSIGLRWSALMVAGVGAVVLANFARVFVLTQLVLTFGPQPWIDIIHVPLGMIGFVVVCGSFYFALKKLGSSGPVCEAKSDDTGNQKLAYPALVIAPVLAIILHTPFQKQHEAPASMNMPSLDALTSEQIELTSAEHDLFSRFDAVHVGKYRLAKRFLEGSLLVSRTSHWRAHHNPEQCFRGNGLAVKTTRPYLIADLPVRGVVTDEDKLLGVFWFQAKDRYTDDFSERIFASLWDGEKDWVMVSILFDQPRKFDDSVESLVSITRNSLTQWMNGDGSQI